ncbi:gastrula zinc finger protein XlCGF66.1-like [Dendropsophus ebraccatus]|uniref:gastrula zinc finger protein XlCGF66.1-like n=1 Tax=Dendropsophus ebraccatus TaxID=150705 RepID=UPI0038320C9A
MERDRDKMAERIITLTLESLFRLTEEDYSVVKKSSSGRCGAPGCEGWGRTLSPIPGPLIHEEMEEEKILEVTNKMVELLSGEVPIRCQDVAVYFSMEEWEYVEGHKDQYKDVMLEDPVQSLICGYDWRGERINKHKILEVTNKMVELLTGEVSLGLLGMLGHYTVTPLEGWGG